MLAEIRFLRIIITVWFLTLMKHNLKPYLQDTDILQPK